MTTFEFLLVGVLSGGLVGFGSGYAFRGLIGKELKAAEAEFNKVLAEFKAIVSEYKSKASVEVGKVEKEVKNVL